MIDIIKKYKTLFLTEKDKVRLRACKFQDLQCNS